MQSTSWKKLIGLFDNMGLQVLICDRDDAIARIPSKTEARTHRWMQITADKFRRHRAPITKLATLRRPAANINKLMRWRIVTEYHKLIGEGSRPPPGGLKSLES